MPEREDRTEVVKPRIMPQRFAVTRRAAIGLIIDIDYWRCPVSRQIATANNLPQGVAADGHSSSMRHPCSWLTATGRAEHSQHKHPAAGAARTCFSDFRRPPGKNASFILRIATEHRATAPRKVNLIPGPGKVLPVALVPTVNASRFNLAARTDTDSACAHDVKHHSPPVDRHAPTAYVPGARQAAMQAYGSSRRNASAVPGILVSSSGYFPRKPSRKRLARIRKSRYGRTVTAEGLAAASVQ